ncbi:exportin-2-like, partial [Olea europaea subsp. europaea]
MPIKSDHPIVFNIQKLISKHNAMALLPDVVRFLGSESNVVHSYFASCIEKLLSIKDEGFSALLAQLVDLNQTHLLENYIEIFAIPLLPESWKKSTNALALVHLLQAFVKKSS